jgi:argininosuccinate synthase
MLKWLTNKGYTVIAYVADVGQKENFQEIKEKALKTGASKVYIIDLKRELIEKYFFEMLKANAIYEGQYLLGTAIARPIIAKKQVEIAKKEGTNILAHGCTGKGNDQVRFELTWMYFMPDVKIISPWKDKEWLSKFTGRPDLIKYAEKENIPINVSLKKPYSTDENLIHISFESGILEDISCKPKKEMFKFTKSPKDAPNKETDIIIEFKKGKPVKVTNMTDGKIIKGTLELINYLNQIASENGIGRIDIVENRFVGIKSRGVYETPAGTILFKAHKDLESIILDREVIHLKELFAPMIAKLIYNGFWFSPEMEFLMAAITQSQQNVTGKVSLSLYKGNVIVTSRKSKYSIYDKSLSSMDIEGGFDQKDAEGFIKINGLKFKIFGGKNEAMGKGFHNQKGN